MQSQMQLGHKRQQLSQHQSHTTADPALDWATAQTAASTASSECIVIAPRNNTLHDIVYVATAVLTCPGLRLALCTNAAAPAATALLKLLHGNTPCSTRGTFLKSSQSLPMSPGLTWPGLRLAPAQTAEPTTRSKCILTVAPKHECTMSLT
jgi:hypothetical protein